MATTKKTTKNIKSASKAENSTTARKASGTVSKMSNNFKAYFAELFGAFALSFIVIANIGLGADAFLPTPVLAGLTLGLFVYTVGSLSGTHINPAVTLGLLSIGKIKVEEAVKYIIAQLIGVLAAVSLYTSTISDYSWTGFYEAEWSTYIYEFIGVTIFTYGIAAVVYKKVDSAFSGVVVGLSLLLGVAFAVTGGAAGALNPAVAIALGEVNLSYILGPIIGSIFGFNLFKLMHGEK